MFDLTSDAAVTVMRRPAPLPPRLSEAELTEDAAFVAELGQAAFWSRIEG